MSKNVDTSAQANGSNAATEASATVTGSADSERMAEYAVRKNELGAILNRTCKLAQIEHSAAIAKADVWGTDTDRGKSMVVNADKALRDAVKEAETRYNDNLAKWCAENGFTHMLSPDQILATYVRRVENTLQTVADLQASAAKLGVVISSSIDETGKLTMTANFPAPAETAAA